MRVHTQVTPLPPGWCILLPLALGRRDLDFASHPNDDGEPWERFSESSPNRLAGVVFMSRVLDSGHPSKYWSCWMTDSMITNNIKRQSVHWLACDSHYAKIETKWSWRNMVRCLMAKHGHMSQSYGLCLVFNLWLSIVSAGKNRSYIRTLSCIVPSCLLVQKGEINDDDTALFAI